MTTSRQRRVAASAQKSINAGAAAYTENPSENAQQTSRISLNNRLRKIQYLKQSFSVLNRL